MNENERRQTTKGEVDAFAVTAKVVDVLTRHLTPRNLDVQGQRHECTRDGRRGHRWARAWRRSSEILRCSSAPLGTVTNLALLHYSAQDFERKSALFSMAVAEVLIVNIWEHQVGLYQGANMGLLKTVFEVNLGLFLAAKEKGKIAGS